MRARWTSVMAGKGHVGRKTKLLSLAPPGTCPTAVLVSRSPFAPGSRSLLREGAPSWCSSLGAGSVSTGRDSPFPRGNLTGQWTTAKPLGTHAPPFSPGSWHRPSPVAPAECPCHAVIFLAEHM